MAPKATPPVAKPISLSRDDDEDESEDVAEEEEEEDESEETGDEEAGHSKKEESSEDGSEAEEDESNGEGQQSKKPRKERTGKLAMRSVEKKPDLKKSVELKPDSDSDSDSDSGSFQTQPSPDASNFTIKPIFPAAGAKSSSSKKLSLCTPPPPKSSKSPAPLAEAEPPKGSEPVNRMKKKRKKPSVGHDAMEKSKKVWSEDDETAVLIGLNDFRTNKGANPHDDTAALYEFLMTYLHNGFSKAQVTNKIKRLKKKFLGNAERLQGGGGPLLSRPHDHKVFELGKKIWGLEKCSKEKKGSEKDSKNEKTDLGSEGAMENGVAEVKAEEGGDAEKFWCELPWLKASMGFMQESCRGVALEKMNLIGRVKARELDERWRKVRAAETETELDKICLLSEQTKLVLDMFKSSGP